ncbi:hypothetical protein [Paracidobacterium acidisoli]|uniref:Uncharacterized protein n=1 Tax=Paracidobacterium acidisoli TaxID=2303751 RepID=A0A372IPS2_9BACT|nr:hypothetical protein [Paracidobacterium acidisoli]MBT9331064.1 hypothetical protein [Paracidobacterium acidisoli]
MKPFALALLFAATTTAAYAEAECPVELTAVSPAAQAHLQLTSPVQSEGGIELSFRNQSGKEIRSMEVGAELKVKRNVYDLDAATVKLDLTVSGTGVVDPANNLMRSLPVDAALFGVGTVTLEEVTFADGSVWTPAGRVACSVRGNGTQRIEMK